RHEPNPVGDGSGPSPPAARAVLVVPCRAGWPGGRRPQPTTGAVESVGGGSYICLIEQGFEHAGPPGVAQRRETRMSRRYQDPVEVRLGDPVEHRVRLEPGWCRGAQPPGAEAGVPTQFLWQGRVHVVRGVLAQWSQRVPWWRA